MLDLSIVKTELEQKLRELLDRAAEIENSLSAPKNADSAERAMELENDETSAAIGAITDAEIRDIKFALHRIESGQYSTCEICEKHIPNNRLLALPWTSRCSACK